MMIRSRLRSMFGIFVAILCLASFASSQVQAIDLTPDACKSPTSQEQKDQCSLIAENKLNKDGNTSAIKNGVETALRMLGIIAVIMIVVGGMRYTLSMGDPSGIQNAKNTILYAVIGLVVAILSFAIIQLVSTYFK